MARLIARELLEFLQHPRHMIHEITATVRSEALRYVQRGDCIVFCGIEVIVRDISPIGDGTLSTLQCFYPSDPIFAFSPDFHPAAWGNPEIMRASHDMRDSD